MSAPRPRRNANQYVWVFECLEDRTLLSLPAIVENGDVAPGAPAVYPIFAATDSLLVATVHALGAATQLSVLDQQGDILLQSDGQSPSNPDDKISLHVTGNDYLEVQSLGAPASFTLSYTLTPSTVPNAPSLPDFADVGDYNGDGITDYVDYSGVHLGLGDGTFQSNSIPLPADALIGNTVSADFNGDGKLDIASVGYSYQSDATVLHLLVGNGDGTFMEETPLVLSASNEFVQAIVTGDFTGDGPTDVAVLASGYTPTGESTNATIQICINNGHGDFTARQQIQIDEPFASGLVSGDFTGDGRDDLAFETQADNGLGPTSITVLLSNVDGTFQSSAPVRPDPDSYPSGGLAAFRINRGSREALAVAEQGVIATYLCDSGGTLRPGPSIDLGSSSASASTLTTGDFNGDGFQDIAFTGTGSSGQSIVQVALNDGDGTFSLEPAVTIAPSEAGFILLTGDFNGDKKTDLALSSVFGTNSEILLGEGDGRFSAPPLEPSNYITTNPATSFGPFVMGDFNGDGLTDLFTSNSFGDQTLLSNGDGTFRASATVNYDSSEPYPLTPVAAGDFNNDGHTDVASIESYGTSMNLLQILLGAGDGSFHAAPFIKLSDAVYDPTAVTGDFNGDGNLDLAIVEAASSVTIESQQMVLQVLLGNGRGGFQVEPPIPLGVFSNVSLVAGNFTDDGRDDLAILETDASSFGQVVVKLSNHNGTFGPDQIIDTTSFGEMNSISIGDFSNDDRKDLVISGGSWTDYAAQVQIDLSNGDGTFTTETPVEFPSFGYFSASSVTIGDFNGDGNLDIIVGNTYGTSSGGNIDDLFLNVGLGVGDGTFQFSPTAVMSLPSNAIDPAVISGNFIRNGYANAAVYLSHETPQSGLDLLSNASLLTDNYSVTPVSQFDVPVASTIGAFISTDLNGDGRPDLASVAEDYSGDFHVDLLLGNGDGTFATEPSVSTDISNPVALVAGDFNGDGHEDLAAAGFAPDGDAAIQVFWGTGNATFATAPLIDLGDVIPIELVAGDLTGNGRDDLALTVTDPSGRSFLDVLLGQPSAPSAALGPIAPSAESGKSTSIQPRGTFVIEPPLPLGTMTPHALVAGDFTGDGVLDLALGGNLAPGSGVIQVLQGNGDGMFTGLTALDLQGLGLTSLVAGDFDDDGTLDLAALVIDIYYYNESVVDILLGNGDGTFGQSTIGPWGYFGGYGLPAGLLVGDFNADGHVDVLAVSGSSPTQYLVLFGNGDGTFRFSTDAPFGSPLSDVPFQVVAGDLNGDGRTDLAFSVGAGLAGIAFSRGDGSFSFSDTFSGTTQDTPVVYDLEGRTDTFVVTQAGAILWRKAKPGDAGLFQPPIAVNVDPETNALVPARDFVLFTTAMGPIIASVDVKDDGVSLFVYRAGVFVLYRKLATGALPVQIVAGDLNDDGNTDLVVRDAGDGTATVFLGDGDGNFTRQLNVTTGLGASSIALLDLSESVLPELVVSNDVSGDVLVFPGNGDGTFAAPAVYPAGSGPYDQSYDADVVSSIEGTAGLAAATLTRGGTASLVTMNPGTSSLAILAGLGNGTLANPITSFTSQPGAVIRAGDFNGDGISDLAVLSNDSLSVYLGDGHGGFDAPESYPIDPNSTGLTVADVNRDGIPDLLVGNGFGDIQVLLGNGKGGFSQPKNVNQQVALAVTTVGPTGPVEYAYASFAQNSVAVQAAGSKTPQALTVQDPSKSVLSPTAVTYADVNGDGIPDAIVANGGGNDVLVFLGEPGGGYAPGEAFAVGTDPVSVTVADLNGDGIPDLVVANQGSNDVSILLGQGQGARWTLAPQLRLQAGYGPSGTAVADVNHDGIPDIVVTDSQTNQVRVLTGVGQGYFNDTSPAVLPTGTAPGPVFVGNFTGNPGQLVLLTVNTGSNNLSEFLDVNGSFVPQVLISSAGEAPVAAVEGEFVPGTTDLLVANLDGTLALFVSGPNGLDLMKSFEAPGLPNPTSLAVDEAGAIFGTSAGVEAAVQIVLGLGGESAAISALAGPEEQQTVELQPLTPSSLGLVATLVSAMTTSETDEPLEIGFAALPNQPLSRGVSVEGQGEETAPDEDEALAATPGAQEFPPPVVEYIIGFNEELANVRLRVHEGSLLRGIAFAFAAQQPRDTPSSRLAVGPSTPDVSAIPATAPEADNSSDAIDAAIDELAGSEPIRSVSEPSDGPTGGETRVPAEWYVRIGAASIALTTLYPPVVDSIRSWRSRHRSHRSRSRQSPTA